MVIRSIKPPERPLRCDPFRSETNKSLHVIISLLSFQISQSHIMQKHPSKASKPFISIKIQKGGADQ